MIWTTKQEALAILNIAERTLRDKVRKGEVLTKGEGDAQQYQVDDTATIEISSKPLRKAKVYVVTSAQNHTKVHKGFDSLLTFCKEHKAVLVVVPQKYRYTMTMGWATDRNPVSWDERLIPYLWQGSQYLNENLLLAADISIPATTQNPCSGFENLANSGHILLGHSQLQLEPVAAFKKEATRFVRTSGSVTLPNYVDSAVGKKRQATHACGATIVERADDKTFYPREITFNDDGSFTDLDTVYTAKGVHKAPPAISLRMGDVHVVKSDNGSLNSSVYGRKSMVKRLRPKVVIADDVHDQESKNHHNRGLASLPVNYHLFKEGRSCVKTEVDKSCAFLADLQKRVGNVYVMHSNHDNALTRWVYENNMAADPQNAKIHAELAYLLAQADFQGGALELYFRKYYGLEKEVTFFRAADVCVVGGIHHTHSHVGVNGARGSKTTWAKMGIPIATAHSHSPYIKGKAKGVGVSGNLFMGYNPGPSTCAHADLVTHADGKTQLLFTVRGKYTNFPIRK